MLLSILLIDLIEKSRLYEPIDIDFHIIIFIPLKIKMRYFEKMTHMNPQTIIEKKQISLATQVNKVIRHRILLLTSVFVIIIFDLTIYGLPISIKQLQSRIKQQIKPIETFVINQAIINSLDLANFKIQSFNENNPIYHIEWIQHGSPMHKTITWYFPSSWIYDYSLDNLGGVKFGYFKISGDFLSDKTLLYDLSFIFIQLLLFIISNLTILYFLTKISDKLFINSINRFIDLISQNSVKNNNNHKLSISELEILENKILLLLETAREHERSKTAIELGNLLARLAHDIHSPLTAMEICLDLLAKKTKEPELSILINAIKSIRDIANNVLHYHHTQEVTNTTSANNVN